jgi:hypothetical protein
MDKTTARQSHRICKSSSPSTVATTASRRRLGRPGTKPMPRTKRRAAPITAASRHENHRA